MNDYISIQKNWFDNDIAQLVVTCSSETITASTKIYVTDKLIDDLSQKINDFLSGQAVESYWINEEKGDNSPPCISFRFLSKDKLGHVLVEVYMELDDGGSYSVHNCCFYINTEIGLLERFYTKLPILKQKILDVEVVLNDKS